MSLKRRLARVAERLTGTHIVHQSEVHQLPERLHLRRFIDHFGVDCVFDVGANEGQYARQLRQEVGYSGWIISFEPIPELAEQLRQRADPKWKVCQLALDREAGPTTFNIMAESVFSSLHAPSRDQPTDLAAMNTVSRRVDVMRATLATELPKWQAELGFERPFLKMDTQGNDLRVVQGAGDAIGAFVGLQSELSVHRLYDDSPGFAEALAVYEALGFQLSALVANTAGHFPRLLELDCIMFRRDNTGAACR